MRIVPLLSLVCLVTVPSFSEEAWVRFSLPSEAGDQTLDRLAVSGIESLTWRSATVEISAFDGLQTVKLSELDQKLTPDDPRWDPWLEAMVARFQPGEAVSVWIPAEQAGEAGLVSRSPSTSPGTVTGWGLIGFTAFFFLLLCCSGRVPDELRRRVGVQLGIAVLLFIGGVSLIVRGEPQGEVGPQGVTWAQHRWYQENWPWGARWEDYSEGQGWTTTDYQLVAGQVLQRPGRRAVADSTWLEAAWASLESTNVARIFGSPNP